MPQAHTKPQLSDTPLPESLNGTPGVGEVGHKTCRPLRKASPGGAAAQLQPLRAVSAPSLHSSTTTHLASYLRVVVNVMSKDVLLEEKQMCQGANSGTKQSLSVIPGAAKAAGRGRFSFILTGQLCSKNEAIEDQVSFGMALDALKKRVRAFAEGAVIMACPVLLAIALQKVNLKSVGNGGFLPGSISPLAALTLEAGLLPFLCLSLPRLLVAQADFLFRASKVLIHLCALLLMALAGGILLISTKNRDYIAVLVPLVLLTLRRCFLTMRNGHDDDDAVYRGCDEMLERSLDFSASVTSLLFLGLEGLALEGQSSGGGQLLQGQPWLSHSLGVTFIACALGVVVMLLGTVPPLVNDNARVVLAVVEALNVLLAVVTAVAVLLITSGPLGVVALLLFVPLLLSFVVWMYTALAVDDGHQLAGHGAAVAEGEGFCRPPASMELTKVTFTGFLAVSVPTYSDSSISSYTHGFILLTAAAVVSGLGWRLLTHRTAPSRALVTAASVSSFCAHLCVAASVVPFTAMAVNALK